MTEYAPDTPGKTGQINIEVTAVSISFRENCHRCFHDKKRRKATMIDRRIEERLYALYDPESQFHLNRAYSSNERHVYTLKGDKYHWLTITRESRDLYCVSRTDATGLITMQDRYQKDENMLRYVSKKQLVTKGGRSVLELLRQNKKNAEQTITIGNEKPKNKGEQSL